MAPAQDPVEDVHPFVVEGVLGHGGSAIVYASRLGKERVALKVSRERDPAQTERFLEEALKLGRISHPAIVRVLDAGALTDGRGYLAMPLLEGETLAARLERGAFDQDEALRVFAALASGVRALHEAGLVHRDIKSENIFLVGDPASPVLLDLGIAKDVSAEPSTATQQGIVRGTPAVMAPERFFGQPATVASDVYELAVVLYAMLLGSLPWDDGTDVDQRLATKPPHDVDATIPAHVSDAILEALASRPAKRPISIKAFCDRVLARPDVARARRTTEPRTVEPSAAGPRPIAERDTAQGVAASKAAAPGPWRARTLVVAASVVALAAVAFAVLPSLTKPADGGPGASDMTAPSSSDGAPSQAATPSPSTLSPVPPDGQAPPALAVGGEPAATANPSSGGGPSRLPAPAAAEANASAQSEVASSASAIASVQAPAPSASGSASAKWTPPTFADYPSCQRLANAACEGATETMCGFQKAEMRREIDRAKPAERAKADANCQKRLVAFQKRRADETKADELIDSKLPTCKAWVAKSCAADVKSRRATRSFCFFNQDTARHLALTRFGEAAALCQGRLDKWQDAVDDAVRKDADQERENELSRSRPRIFGLGQM